jgi:small GTP-binding protein
MSFTLAIVGRPNVGKSTLFNRLVGRRLALVDDRPGVTRDRREGQARLGDLAFTVVDTAGFDEAAPGSLTSRMVKQTELAIESADAVLFLVDVRTGLTPIDRAFADIVRRAGKPVMVVANKARAAPGQAPPKPMSSGSAIRSPSPPNTAKGCPTSTTRSARPCRNTPLRPRKKTRATPTSPRARSASRWSGAPTSASRP